MFSLSLLFFHAVRLFIWLFTEQLDWSWPFDTISIWKLFFLALKYFCRKSHFALMMISLSHQENFFFLFFFEHFWPALWRREITFDIIFVVTIFSFFFASFTVMAILKTSILFSFIQLNNFIVCYSTKKISSLDGILCRKLAVVVRIFISEPQMNTSDFSERLLWTETAKRRECDRRESLVVIRLNIKLVNSSSWEKIAVSHTSYPC